LEVKVPGSRESGRERYSLTDFKVFQTNTHKLRPSLMNMKDDAEQNFYSWSFSSQQLWLFDCDFNL